jgi:L-threonylcarbamoyladenylate synthase
MAKSQIVLNCTAESISEAVNALCAGHLVAFPTETVYGLGADAINPEAVKRIYEVKGRPIDHPLIVHISSRDQIDKWAVDVPEYAIKLARKFWPGPMTLILRRSELVGDFITGGQNTVGLRVPNDQIALALISEFEKVSHSAIAAPSANRFGQVSPTSGSDVWDELESYLSEFDLILDGGNSAIGIESTIVECTGGAPMILRSGAVTKEEIEFELGISCIENLGGSDIKFSGVFQKHYAPKCRVIIGADSIEGAGFLALVGVETPIGMTRLATPTTTREFARILYATFRAADQSGFATLVVCLPLGQGLPVAIKERVEKATQGR